MDLYSTLGVTKTASQDEIKKAYKKLAMKHHPDRGGDSEKLSKINEAYTVLKNPEKRKQYDHGVYPGSGQHNKQGYHGFYGNRPDMGSIFDDIFNAQGFGNGFRGNANIQMKISISISECFTGKEYNTTYSMRNGEQKSININIPPGLCTGDVLRVKDGGDHSNKNAPPGDLMLNIMIRTPAGWEVHENHLLTACDVSVFDLMIGTHKIIESPVGKKLKLTIPAGTQNDTVMQITGEGLPSKRTKQNGNIHVKIKSFIPTIKDDTLIEKIEGLKNEISEISSKNT